MSMASTTSQPRRSLLRVLQLIATLMSVSVIAFQSSSGHTITVSVTIDPGVGNGAAPPNPRGAAQVPLTNVRESSAPFDEAAFNNGAPSPTPPYKARNTIKWNKAGRRFPKPLHFVCHQVPNFYRGILYQPLEGEVRDWCQKSRAFMRRAASLYTDMNTYKGQIRQGKQQCLPGILVGPDGLPVQTPASSRASTNSAVAPPLPVEESQYGRILNVGYYAPPPTGPVPEGTSQERKQTRNKKGIHDLSGNASNTGSAKQSVPGNYAVTKPQGGGQLASKSVNEPSNQAGKIKDPVATTAPSTGKELPITPGPGKPALERKNTVTNPKTEFNPSMKPEPAKSGRRLVKRRTKTRPNTVHHDTLSSDGAQKKEQQPQKPRNEATNKGTQPGKSQGLMADSLESCVATVISIMTACPSGGGIAYFETQEHLNVWGSIEPLPCGISKGINYGSWDVKPGIAKAAKANRVAAKSRKSRAPKLSAEEKAKKREQAAAERTPKTDERKEKKDAAGKL